ncbi:MAG: response regulator [Magnetococcales bacterium]|nr:response regulator [Magnetococcales bacterium]MBF0414227.1 response regulator [Magnetococcales bacterium]
MKILIADDDETNRLLLAKILQPLGDSDLVVDGQEAVEAFELALTEGEPYELVFLDIMMPGKNGLEVLKCLRGLEQKHVSPDRATVKIFMVTALGTEQNVHEAFVEGNCTDFFIKPVNKRMVLEKLADNGIVLE